jgi:hypothetical protein
MEGKKVPRENEEAQVVMILVARPPIRNARPQVEAVASINGSAGGT